MWRVGLPTFAAAVVTSGIAIAINYATSGQNNVWAWAIVGALTLISAGVSVWLYRQADSPDTASVGGNANVNIGRKNRMGKVRADARRDANVNIGAGSQLGELRVTAGTEPPREDPAPGERDAT
jgi:hypothetical protein